jgi:hypothetical protein
MYTSTYAPLDSSARSNTAPGVASGDRVTGSHLYAAAHRDMRIERWAVLADAADMAFDDSGRDCPWGGLNVEMNVHPKAGASS